MEAEWYMFPICNEQGFRVVDTDSYAHMIAAVMNAQTELQEEYPDKHILVVYEV